MGDTIISTSDRSSYDTNLICYQLWKTNILILNSGVEHGEETARFPMLKTETSQILSLPWLTNFSNT
ncbi:hypothetical protein [Myxosarcina sp. GI1]|uniref:hypothetical protein n=1 Tax=Myxosarcina sp. GI1 TaxID=1541065 RepID=UPI00056300A1|nr:hypothetical protein [Myxosarcina sp. GI1]